LLEHQTPAHHIPHLRRPSPPPLQSSSCISTNADHNCEHGATRWQRSERPFGIPRGYRRRRQHRESLGVLLDPHFHEFWAQKLDQGGWGSPVRKLYCTRKVRHDVILSARSNTQAEGGSHPPPRRYPAWAHLRPRGRGGVRGGKRWPYQVSGRGIAGRRTQPHGAR
jgi:hypothetical protein